jgi:putative transposase
VIAALAGQGLSAKRCCRICGVAPSGYFRWRGLPPSAGELRRRWLRGLITQVHTASRATYGYRRVRAELVLGYGLQVSNKLVAKLMAQEQLKGLPSRRRRRNLVAAATAADLVARDFQRPAPDQLWMTDITEHPTREGKLYCCVVLDAHSRRVIGWSIDSSQTAALVTNALGMAIANRKPDRGTVLHSDHGSQTGFNWSSQHLECGGADGQTSGVDDGAYGQVPDEVAGGSLAAARCGAVVLA